MSPRNSSSLSFLDLLTCGLGGMLLLFFVVVALKQQSDVIGADRSEDSGNSGASSVLITLRATNGDQLFDTDGKHFAIFENAQQVEEWPISAKEIEGPGYAIFFAPQGLPSGMKLFLFGVRKEVAIDVFVVDSFGSRNVTWNDRASELLYSFGSASIPKSDRPGAVP